MLLCAAAVTGAAPWVPRCVYAQSTLSDRGPVGTGEAVSTAMSGPLIDDMPHMRTTKLRPPAPGDSARAAAILAALRPALAPYADYHHALADGYRIFAPAVPQHVYHFTSRRRAFWSAIHFNPAEPSSLLYEKTSGSTYRLVGAMYTAPRRASLGDLDARVPLSMATWHRHTNWCVPRRGGAASYMAKGPDGRPLFGGRGSITTRAACRSAGGRFFAEPFGWMVHVYPFATDPAQVWGAGDMHDMHDMHDTSYELWSPGRTWVYTFRD